MLGTGSTDDVGDVEVHFGSSILETRSAASMSATANAEGENRQRRRVDRPRSGGRNCRARNRAGGTHRPSLRTDVERSISAAARPGSATALARDARNRDLVRGGGHLCAANYPKVLEFGVGVARLGAAEDLPAGSQLELGPPFVWHHAQKPLEPEVDP